jgi:hypothetical protein
MRHVTHMGKLTNAFRICIEKLEEKERTWHRWEDNIKIDLKEIVCDDVDWIHLAQGKDQWQALVNMVMNLQVPWKMGNFLIS